MSKKKISVFVFLLSFFTLIIAINLVSAQQTTCSAGECYIAETNSCLEEGEVINSKYCLNASLIDQKQKDSTCLNSYECIGPYSCIEQICQEKYTKLNRTMLDEVNAWFSSLFGGGNQCASGEILCSDGVCRTSCTTPGGGGGGNGGGGGGTSSCLPTWSCTQWSNDTYKCGTRNCREIVGCRNPGSKPDEIRSCPTTAPITPIVEPPYCGDNACNEDAGENCDSCSYDCKENCPAPVAEDNGNGVWLTILIIIIILIIIAIATISVILYRKKMGSDKFSVLKSNQKPQTKPSGATPQNSKGSGPEDKSFRNLDLSRR
ncbi:hypothetical protein J4466_03235 [Candidatus Pacearchaeota archaeon]|nr:hypothetical protein [Candidatus Pacearchaeota archaeon]